jgi:ribonuclease-3
MRLFAALELELGYQFRDPRLLKKALTHSSHAHEQTGEDNEQLEFHGDAVLGFIVSDILYRSHPTLSEGQLSRLKGFFVSAANLVKYAEQLGLGQYLHLGKGEEKTGGRTKQALLVDAFEAIIGAVYMDGGLDDARSLIVRFFESQVGDAGDAGEPVNDYKTALQESMQSHSSERIQYKVVSESGPDHQKLFTVDIEAAGITLARGMGLTKKAAEQAAAKQALIKLRREQEYSTHDRNNVQKIGGPRVL